MKTINTKSKRADKLAEEAQELLSQGYEVVFAMPETTKPERILKIMDATIGDFKVKVAIKDAKFSEYLKSAGTGAVMGAGAFTIACLYAVGMAVALPVVLTAMAIGALAGFVIGAAVAPISEVKVYKYRGETRLKLIPATV